MLMKEGNQKVAIHVFCIFLQLAFNSRTESDLIYDSITSEHYSLLMSKMNQKVVIFVSFC